MKSIILATGLAAALCSSAGIAQTTIRGEFLSIPCIVSVAHGRNLSKSDPKANEFWNKVNASLQKFLEDRLIEDKVTIENDFFPVEAADEDARWKDVAKLANQKRCPLLLQLAAYAERPNEMTVRISVNRMSYEKTVDPSGTQVSVGKQTYEREYKYDTTGSFGQTFIFSQVARRYAEDLLASPVQP